MFETIIAFLSGLTLGQWFFPFVWATVLVFLMAQRKTVSNGSGMQMVVMAWWLYTLLASVSLLQTSSPEWEITLTFWIMRLAFLGLYIALFIAYHLGHLVVMNSLRAIKESWARFQAWRERRHTEREQSDAVVLQRAKQYAQEILDILPEAGWEAERRTVKNFAQETIPELVRHRAQLTADIAAVERDLARQAVSAQAPPEAMRARVEGNLAKLRQMRAEVERDLSESLSFLDTVESDFRVALHDNQARTNLAQIFESLLEQIRRNGDAHTAADREVRLLTEDPLAGLSELNTRERLRVIARRDTEEH